jgi:AraC-like DNA-binding protein
VPLARRIGRGRLAPHIEALWLAEGYAPPHARERVLPTGRMDLVIRLNDAQDPGSFAGARSTSFVLDTSRPLSVIGVRFKAGGGAGLIGLPAGELHNLEVSLDNLWRSDTPRLLEELFRASDPEAKLHVLEQFLLSKLRGNRHGAVDYALTQFQRSLGASSIREIVEHTGLSSRRFIAAFRDQVGLTPKVFARLCRFRRAIGSLQGSTDVDWADTALTCGYFDQAHLIRDFREFSGMSPSVYLRHRTSSVNHVRCPD